MALGKRKPAQQPLFVSTADLAALRPHPYYDAVNKVLGAPPPTASTPLSSRRVRGSTQRRWAAPGWHRGSTSAA